MTLQKAEDTLRSIKGHEEAVIFDKNMNVLAAYSGGSGSVGLPDSLKTKDGITITHNHPTGDTNYGVTFSPSDISWFATSKATEIRAVGAGQGEYVYSLSVTGKQSQTAVKYAKTQLNLLAASIRKDTIPKSKGGTGKLQSEYQSLVKKYIAQGKSEASAKHSAWQQATGAIDKQLKQKANAKGMQSVYFSKNKKYNVNR